MTIKFSKPKTNYHCCLPASHDPHVMEIYGNKFVQTGKLFLFPIVGNNAIEPERSVSLFEERRVKSKEKRSITDITCIYT